MALYMLFTGKVQGAVKGDATAEKFEDQIVITSVEFGMGHPISASSGLTTGRQVVRPLVITKKVDKSSPLLLTACITNEVATSIVIKYVQEGDKHAPFIELKLTNAIIGDFEHVSNDTNSRVEKLSFTFQKCEYTWLDGGITAMFDLAS